jgi:hypothetical protein
MKYPKHFITIADKQYDIGNDFTLKSTLNQPYATLDFQFPDIERPSWSTRDFKIYDAVKLFFKWFPSAATREAASLDKMDQVFYGYIDRLEPSLSKAAGRNYQAYCKSTVGLAWERTSLIPAYEADIGTIIRLGIENSGILDFVPKIDATGIPRTLIVKVNAKKFFGEVLDELKKNYATHIFQTGDGTLRIRQPFWLAKEPREVRTFDVEQDIFNLDYGDIANAVDSVVVVGTNVIGMAFDPVSYQLKQGVDPKNLEKKPKVDGTKLHPWYVYRRDLFDTQSCQNVAQNILVERARNYQISFEREYLPGFEVGDPFVIVNDVRIIPTQKWIANSITTKFSKNKVSSTVTAYSNSVSDLPDDLLLNETGLLDTDILNVSDKENNLVKLH